MSTSDRWWRDAVAARGIAEKALRDEPGEISEAKADHEVFRYREKACEVVFYPHRTSAGNYHIRIRLQRIRNAQRARELASLLSHAAGANCTFQCRSLPKEGAR